MVEAETIQSQMEVLMEGINNTPYRNLQAYQWCTEKVAREYAIFLAGWTLTVIFTEGFAAPAAAISIAIAQVKVQNDLHNCKVENCL